MRKRRLLQIMSISLFWAVLLVSKIYAQEVGVTYPQPQVGSILITPENLREILDSLKSLQNSVSEIQKVLLETLKKVEASKIDIEPLKEKINVTKEILESLQGEILKKLDEESKFAKEEFLSKLDFLTTVMRRAMVVFKNIEDLTKEAQILKDQVVIAGEELKKLTELSKKGFEDNRESQLKIAGLLIVNLILLSFLVFLQLEKTFRKPFKKKGDETNS